MGYNPFRKKNLWDEITGAVSGAAHDVGNAVGSFADKVIPGDQSSWHDQPQQNASLQPRDNSPITIQQSQPQAIATFTQPKQQSIASFEQPKTTQPDLQITSGAPVQATITDPNAVHAPVNTPIKVVSQPQNQQTISVAKPQQQPNIQVAQAPAQPKNNYTDYTIANPQTKKILGVDVGQYLGDYGKTYDMKVGNQASLTQDQFLKGFDNISQENAHNHTGKQTRDMYVNKLQDMAKNGDKNAQFTLKTLQDNGKLTGGFSDAIASANNEFLGGINRSAARAIELLPGDQGTGKWADNQDQIWEGSTKADKFGTNVGKAERMALDAGLIITPVGVVEKAWQGTRAFQAINDTSKVLGYGAKVLAGSLPFSADNLASEALQGHDQNVGQSLAIGTATDLAVPIVGKVLTKIPGVRQGLNAVGDLVSSKFSNLIGTGATDVTEAIAKETNPEVISKALNVPSEVANQLAGETDKNVIKQTLQQLAVDPNIQLTPKMRKRLEDEGITSVKQGDTAYGAQYNPDGSLTFKDQASVTPDNVYHEVGHKIYDAKLTPDEKAVFQNIHGDAWKQAQGRAGYTPDNYASEDFSNFTRMALEGNIDQVPAEVRGIVAKYAKVAENNIPNNLSTKATNSLQNNADGVKPGGIERAKAEIENGTARPVQTRILPDGTTIIEDGRHRLQAAKELGMTEFPTEDVTHLYSNEQTVKPANNLGIDMTDPRARFANRVNDPATEISSKYGGDPATVNRNIERYGEDATRIMYARKSDALSFDPTTGQGIKSIDAVVTAELKKSGAAKVKVTNSEAPVAPPDVPQMSPEELASLSQSAPALTPEGTPTQVAGEVKTPDLAPTQNLADIPTARGTTDNVNINPDVPIRDTPLGNIAKDFYDNTRNDIGFSDVQKVADNVAQEADKAFKQIGSDFSSVAQKAQQAYESKIPLEQAGLTPNELSLWDKVQGEFDYIRNRASENGRNIGEGDQGNRYFPSQRPGAYPNDASLVAGFEAPTPGNEFSRKAAQDGGIPMNERDFSPQVMSDYITRYADSRVVNEDRVARSLQATNPEVPQDVIKSVTNKLIDVQMTANNAETKINLGGFGKRVTVSNGTKVDLPAKLNEIGAELGRPQTDVIGSPHGLTNGDRINSVMVDNKPLGDVMGLNQHRDAASYAGAQTLEAGGDVTKLSELVRNTLATKYNLPVDDINAMVDSISRISADTPPELVTARVSGVYSTAAKSQLMQSMQDLKIQNPKLRQDVSDLATQILRNGSVEQKLSTKVVRAALTAQNAVFRKFNVSSAMNELSDLTSFVSAYGTDLKALRPDFSTLHTYGLGEPNAAIDPFVKQMEAGTPFKDIATKINNATNLYHFVETYKAAVVATSAREHYMAQGLSGDALTKAVLNDYRTMALPVDAFTKTFLDNYPLYTQYMTWGARNIQKEVKLATGKVAVGKLADMTEGQRIARNLYANLPAKTVFWLSSNALKGSAILTAFGLTDFTGLTNQDYSGISEEDKSNFDRTTQVTNSSTTLSLLNTIVQSYEKEQLKNSDKYKNASYNPYASNNLAGDLINSRTPQVIKNVAGPIGSDTNHGAIGLMKDGYSANKDGRVQYEAPTDPYNTAKAFLFGKGQTDNAREYTGSQNIIQRVQDGQNPLNAVKNMALEQTTLKQSDYTRPLNDQYSAAYKQAENGARTAMLQGGRQYNAYLDNLKKNSPTEYNSYIASLDGNHVSPEFWKGISQDSKGAPDMTTFNTLADRKKQAFKDLGTKYDPLYDLPADQAKAVLQYKSAATGDDLALRGTLNKEGWYKDYKKASADYYAANPTTEGDVKFPESQRVKDWNGLSDKLNGYYYDSTATTTPEWGKTYPMVYEQKRINDTYGFDSPQSKAFFKNNADAYQAQKDGYDQEQLGVINQMREIEGYPPMGAEAYKQATNVASTGGSKKSFGGGGGKGSGQNIHGSYGSTMSTGVGKITVKTPTVAIKTRAQSKPKAIKVTRGGKI